MTDADLEIMVARTGSERLTRVTADDWPDAAERDDARAWVRSMAAEPVWPPPCDGCIRVEVDVEAPEPPAYPPALAQLGNLARAAAGFVASGGKLSADALAAQRLAVCRACPSNLYDAAKGRCRDCGCFARAKARIAAETCPRGHWEAESDAATT